MPTFCKLDELTHIDVFIDFRPSCWFQSAWTPTWRFHTMLYILTDNSSTEYRANPRL